MSQWTETDRRIGCATACAAAAIWVLYVVVGVVGVLARPRGLPFLRQVDPYLAILEWLIIGFAVAIVGMMAALHRYVPDSRKSCSTAALLFNLAFSVLTCAVHFVNLTVGRRMDAKLIPSLFGEWPSVALAVDLLAWDFLLGLALICAAVALRDQGLGRARAAMMAAGVLCLAGTAGPASGHMEIQFLGIVGYAFVLPGACALLALAWKVSSRSG